MTTSISKIEAIRLEMHEWLATEKNENFIEEVAEFVTNLKVEKLGQSFVPMSADEYRGRLQKSRTDYQEGRYKTIEELEESIKKW
jgi:hypothetical protein